jgi:hypothetical protein
MNKCGFSWRRFIGISAFKSRISRLIGIPLTRSGRQRKLGAIIEKFLVIVGLLFLNLIIGIVLYLKTYFEMIIKFYR